MNIIAVIVYKAFYNIIRTTENRTSFYLSHIKENASITKSTSFYSILLIIKKMTVIRLNA